MPQVYDPFASAVEAGEQLPQYFGEIALHVGFVNLEKARPSLSGIRKSTVSPTGALRSRLLSCPWPKAA